MNTEELLKRVRKAERPSGPKKVNTDRWMPVVKELRERGWSYGEIYDWLKLQKEPVQKNKGAFIATVSRRYKNYLWQLTLKPRK